MARIDWVEHRLRMWAMWKVRDESGGLGFPKQSSFMREAFQNGYRDAQIPVFCHEEAVTDQAIHHLKGDRPVLHETLLLHYIGARRQPPMGIKELALYYGVRAEGIHVRLGECDRAIARWLDERAEHAKRVPYTFVHTSAPMADAD